MGGHQHIIVSVTNDLITDQRIHKVASSLVKLGFNVTLVGRLLNPKIPADTIPFPHKRFQLWFNKSILFYANYNIRLFWFLLWVKADVFLSNDLDTLPANYLASRIRRKKLVYDSHELYTEAPELVHRALIRKTWLFMEHLFLPKVKYAYTVCDSIAAYYHKRYAIEMLVVRNVPFKLLELNSKIQKNSHKTIIYQGALNIHRGIERVIRAMPYLEGFKFLIIGNGDIEMELKTLVRKMHLEDCVTFIDRKPYSELIQYTLSADVGVSLEEHVGLNYYYSLPNKLFDYIQCQIPVVCSNFPETSTIVNKYQIGEVTNTTNCEELASIIKGAAENKALYAQGLKLAAQDLCWENEEKILQSVFL